MVCLLHSRAVAQDKRLAAMMHASALLSWWQELLLLRAPWPTRLQWRMLALLTWQWLVPSGICKMCLFSLSGTVQCGPRNPHSRTWGQCSALSVVGRRLCVCTVCLTGVCVCVCVCVWETVRATC